VFQNSAKCDNNHQPTISSLVFSRKEVAMTSDDIFRNEEERSLSKRMEGEIPTIEELDGSPEEIENKRIDRLEFFTHKYDHHRGKYYLLRQRAEDARRALDTPPSARAVIDLEELEKAVARHGYLMDRYKMAKENYEKPTTPAPVE
jgi:hypothetical protein